MDFDTFNLDPRIMAGVRALGYATPTPIQEQAIPQVLTGNDLIGVAQTGTGKTAAFALPILQRLLTGPRGLVRVLVVAPTRELTVQIHEAFLDLGRQTRLRSVAIYGGVGMGPQVENLRSGAEIAVACPGRLLDHVWRGTIDLSHVEVLVIDEADRMFDMGFLPDVRNIIKCLTKPRQTLLFSATMPDDIRRLVREAQHNPVTVQIGRQAPANSVSHALYPVRPHLKTGLLKEILRRTETESVLVFTRTKHRAMRLADQLQRDGYNVGSLHSNLSQNQRQAALDAFRTGRLKVLVATDIASRGIDVTGISHVINYDMPDTTDSYTHRIGRTGRVDRTGEAFTLITNEDARLVRSLEQVLKAPIERRTLTGFDYNAPEPARDPSPYRRQQRPPARGMRMAFARQ